MGGNGAHLNDGEVVLAIIFLLLWLAFESHWSENSNYLGDKYEALKRSLILKQVLSLTSPILRTKLKSAISEDAHPNPNSSKGSANLDAIQQIVQALKIPVLRPAQIQSSSVLAGSNNQPLIHSPA